MRLVLDVAQQVHVLDPVDRGLDMAVHDRRGGGDAKAVGRGDDLNPLLGSDSSGRDEVTDLLVENLGRGARQSAKPGGPKFFEILHDGDTSAGRTVQYLFGRKGVKVQVRQRFFHRPGQVDVKVPIHLGWQTGLHADLGGAHVYCLLSPAHNLCDGEEVALFLAVLTAEGAEGAMFNADVGEVNVPIDHIRDHVAYLTPPHLIGYETQGLQIETIGLAQPQPLTPGNLLSIQSTVEDDADLWIDMLKDTSKPVGCHGWISFSKT